MASIVNYVADGATNQFQIPFTYINQSDVVVTVNGTAPTFTFVNSTTINIASTPIAGAKVIIKRATPLIPLVDFTDGSTLFEADLDLAHQQNRLIAEESRDRADSAIATINANIDNIDTVAGIETNINTVAGNTANINSVATNMAEVLTADDNAATATTKAGEALASAATATAQATIATTKSSESSASEASALASKNAASASESNASASETASANSATASANSASASASSATQASASETTAITKAAEALTSANNSASSANNSANSATIATTKAAQASASESASAISEANALSSENSALSSKNSAATSEVNAASSETNASASEAIAVAKAAEASASEINCAVSEQDAFSSATTAIAQAGIATTKAAEAATSASNVNATELASQANAVAAANSAAAAASALDSFDDKYLGVKSSDPSVDNDGNALVQGALYFSSASSSMQVYDGANWIAASSSGVASLTLFEYTATAGQTVFTGTDDNGYAMSFIAANLLVTMNGVILDPSDFTTTTGTTLTLDVGATVGDLINIYAFKSFNVADTVQATTGGTFLGPVTFDDNVTVNGTVDGRDLAADGTKLDGIATSANNYVHPSAHPISFITGLQGELNTLTTGLGNVNTDLVNDTTPQLGGALDVNGHSISFGDNEKARFGNADDLEIRHNGSHSFVTNTTGNMYLQDDNYVEIGSSSGEVYIGARKDGAVNLRYDNVNKIETTSTGVTVAGTVAATSFTGSGANLTGIEGVPQGVIVMWSGQTSAIPTGWALCDGSNGTPNLIDKFIMGASSSNETTTGGSNSRTLSTANLPSHTHSFSGTTNTTGNHNHSGSTNTTGDHHHLMVTGSMSNQRAQYSITTNTGNYLAGAGGNGYELYYLNGHTSAPTGGKTSTAGNHSHSLSINNNGNHSHTMSGTTGGSGSGTAFDNKPAYMALAYIMKT